jgi:AraC family transcriptional regulator, regulatory protein of adaptative response / DNA-3-methyladenine glycosylase II
MLHDPAALYAACASRDPRFDGVFYVGVTSTGIYCRPVCTAKTPKLANCRFFDCAEAAEKANFRPCLRCRPELAPGNAPVDDAHRIANLIVHHIAEGRLDDQAGLEQIAARFGWSSRQIRRMLHKELGVSPMDLVLTRRLLLAKQLLTETPLSITDVAFASGFASVRRFNDAFGGRYGMPPTHFRKATDSARRITASTDTFMLQLAYRPPFDWGSLLRFLDARALQGAELVRDNGYLRTVQLGEHRGWIHVRDDADRRTLRVELSHSLTPVLPALLSRLRHLFDLSARPDVIVDHLARDPLLANAVSANPGLRVPGAFDGFELGMRAILGQQISVKAATTLSGRVVGAFGRPIETPYEELNRLAPTARQIAETPWEQLAALGVVGTRARSIGTLAREIDAGRLILEPGTSPESTIDQLIALPGIGIWTAHYIAMRSLRWPDAFPKDDMVLRKKLGGLTGSQAEKLSQAWRPWRSYATMHLWAQA